MANLRLPSLAASTVEMKGHIALLLPDLRAGGAQRVFLILAKKFIELGYRVDLLLALEDGEMLGEVPSEVTVITFSRKLGSFGRLGIATRLLFGLNRYVRLKQPSAILSTATGTNLVAVIANEISGTKTRLVLREAASLENLRHPVYKTLMRFLYKRADTVVALTSSMRNELLATLNLGSRRIVVIPNPINFAKVRENGLMALPDDFDQSQPFVLAVGRLVPQKDYKTLISAFKYVADASSLRLVILGEGCQRKSLESQISTLKLQNSVELRGFDSNPYRWMSKASVFVLSSRWEGYPNVVLEAKAFGLPVIMTDYNSSAREVGGNDVIYTPVGDYHSMASHILHLPERISIDFNCKHHSINIYQEVLGL